MMNTTHELHDLRTALLELTPTQQVAVEALAAGATHQEAADAAGVTRETVTRWLGHVPAFKATLNRYRAAIIAEQIDTARRIRGKALAAVEVALDEGKIDPLAVLRVVADTQSVGLTLPEAILDAEINKARIGLPPMPSPYGLDAQLESLRNPPPSDVERAETLVVTRLAVAAGLA